MAISRNILFALCAAVLPAVVQAQPASVEDIVATAGDCLQLANKEGVPLAPLEAAGWVRQENGDFTHPKRVSVISLPQDDDGVSRICVVRADPLTKPDREALSKSLSKLLKTKLISQSDSQIWMVQFRGVRGLQLYDKDSDGSPATRLIAAQFQEEL